MVTLPVEMVEYIFDYLISLEDRKSASLVCQIWYRAYLQNSFRNLEVVNITADRQLKQIMNLENVHREYRHFVMKSADITEASMPFWYRFGPFMKTLTFHNCYIREKMFVAAVSSCTQLESLTIHNCKELLMSGLLLENEQAQNRLKNALKNLKVLNLSYNRYLSDAIIMKILALCPNIISLNLSGCQISYHNGMFKKFYPNGLETPSESVTTFQMIMRYITTHAKMIKSLALSDTYIDSDSLSSLSKTEKLELSVLQLRSCMQLSNPGIIQMSDRFKTLTELDLGSCPRITDTSFIVLCLHLKQLTKLSVQGCRAISDLGLSHVWQLDQLKSLNLAECDMVKGEGIIRGLCQKTNYTMTDLRLSHLGNITEAVVLAVAEFMPNLRHLDLGFCFNAVTDLSVQAIFKQCRWIRTLNFAMCDKITDCGLTGMGVAVSPIKANVQSVPNDTPKPMRFALGSKQEQDIVRDAEIKKEVRELCESEMLEEGKSGITLSSIRGLQVLNLSGCNRVSDVSLKYAFNLTELKMLDLSHCQQISTEGLTHLVLNCPSIQDINLDYCQNVDDKGVECVVRDLRRLKRLVLGSNKLTNTIAIHIANNAVQLTHLDVRHCSQVTASGIGPLTHSLPFLQTFQYQENKWDNDGTFPPPPPIGFWLR